MDEDQARDARRAYSAALRMLGRRELSARQIRERLEQRGYSADTIGPVVERLAATGAVDDARTARAVVRNQLLIKRRGPHRVRRELDAIGIDPDTAGTALREALDQVDQQQLLEAALKRRAPTHTTPLDAASFRRLHAQLVRQGFSSSAVVAALKARRAETI